MTLAHLTPHATLGASGRPGTRHAAGVKEPVAGVAVWQSQSGDVRPSDYPTFDAITGWVVEVRWDELETAQGSLASNNPLDVALAAAEANGWWVKARILFGWWAPSWALTLHTADTVVHANTTNVTKSIIAPWKTSAIDRYRSFLGLLADAYDDHPSLAAVTISGATTSWSETGVYQLATTSASVPNTTRWLAAGYTKAGHVAAARSSIDAHDVFRRTPSVLEVTPWQASDGAGAITWDPDTTVDLLGYTRALLGARGIAGNDSWRSVGHGTLQAQYDAVFDAIAELRGGHAELATDAQVGDHAAAIDLALDNGCCVIELMPDTVTVPHWTDTITPAALTAIAARATANPRP